MEMAEDVAWMKPQNMGKPFNTSKDDFGLIMDLTRTSGFLTSNRAGGVGSDDIYSFQIPIDLRLEGIDEAERFEMDICVYDAQTNERVRGATVVVSEEFMKVAEGQSAEEFINVMNNKTTKRKPKYYISIISVSLVLFLLGLFGFIALNINTLDRYFKENIAYLIG